MKTTDQYCFICKQERVHPGEGYYPCCSRDHKELYKTALFRRSGSLMLSWEGTRRAKEIGLDPALIELMKYTDDEV